MIKDQKNLNYKILKLIQDSGVNSPKDLANQLDISEKLFMIIIQSLTEKGYLRLVDENQIPGDLSFSCKFCPYANECGKSHMISKVFYELSQKGKNILNNYEMREDIHA